MGKKKEYEMKQCTLTKNDDGRVCKTHTWLPAQFAIEGEFVTLRGDDDVWEDGWRVESASHITKSSKYILDRRDDYRKHRSATDI